MKIKIDAFDTGTIQMAKKQLQKFKKKIQNINTLFIKNSLEWIKNRANEYLDERVYAYPNSANIKASWDIQQVKAEIGGEICFQLINTNDKATYVEFGTGIVGMFDAHPIASEVNYEYDKNHHGLQGWDFKFFYNGNLISYEHFTGYEGKHYLYDAYFDYFHKKEYIRIYEQVSKKFIENL